VFALVLLPTKLLQQSKFFRLNEKRPGKRKYCFGYCAIIGYHQKKSHNTYTTLKLYHKLQRDFKRLHRDLKRLQKAKNSMPFATTKAPL